MGRWDNHVVPGSRAHLPLWETPAVGRDWEAEDSVILDRAVLQTTSRQEGTGFQWLCLFINPRNQK